MSIMSDNGVRRVFNSNGDMILYADRKDDNLYDVDPRHFIDPDRISRFSYDNVKEDSNVANVIEMCYIAETKCELIDRLHRQLQHISGRWLLSLAI